VPLRALRAKLAREMPVTQSLGIRVVGRQDGGLVLEAPLAANINHTGTAFAGSLNAAATLAGWGTVWLLLRERGIRAHVVLQDSTVHYVRPVTGTSPHAACRRTTTRWPGWWMPSPAGAGDASSCTPSCPIAMATP
jgi:thioesterase domain-containing protein